MHSSIVTDIESVLFQITRVYASSVGTYPSLQPEYMVAYQQYKASRGSKVRLLCFWEDEKLIGYLPFEVRTRWGVRMQVAFLPVCVGESEVAYVPLLQQAVGALSGFLRRTVFRTHPHDPYITEALSFLDRRGARSIDFVTHIVYLTSRPGKTVRQLVRKAKNAGCTIHDDWSRRIFDSFYEACIRQSRERKHVAVDGSADDVYIFFDSLIKKNIGAFLYVRDVAGTIVSGYLLVYDTQTCVHVFGATSNQGLELYAGYLNTDAAVSWCMKRGITFDLYGVVKDPRMQKYQGDFTYGFKKKWGKEVAIPQRVCAGFFLSSIEALLFQLMYRRYDR